MNNKIEEIDDKNEYLLVDIESIFDDIFAEVEMAKVSLLGEIEGLLNSNKQDEIDGDYIKDELTKSISRVQEILLYSNFIRK